MTPLRTDGLWRTGFGRFLASPYLLLVLAPMFWGGNLVAGKLAVGEVDPLFLLVGRWSGAVLILLPFALKHVRADWGKIRPSLGILGFYGIVGFGTFNVLMYEAVHFTAGINASIEQAGIPVFVLIGNFFIFRVRAYFLQILGLILTIAGVLLVATHGAPEKILSLSINLGDGMVLIACVVYAAYSLALRYKPNIHWLSFILVTAASALVAAIFFQLVFGGGGQLIAEIPKTTLTGWLCILYVMVFPSIAAQLCYARGVEMVGPNRASIFINLLPLFGTLGSIVIVGETFEAYHLGAAILVVAGIGLAEYAVLRKISR